MTTSERDAKDECEERGLCGQNTYDAATKLNKEQASRRIRGGTPMTIYVQTKRGIASCSTMLAKMLWERDKAGYGRHWRIWDIYPSERTMASTPWDKAAGVKEGKA